VSTKEAPLRAILSEAMHAYEIAQLARERILVEQRSAVADIGRDLDAALRRAPDDIRAPALAEQRARAEELANLAASVSESSRALLEAAGLAHVLGAKLGLDQDRTLSRGNAEAASVALADTLRASVDLRVAMVRFARALAEARRFSEARRVSSALLEAASTDGGCGSTTHDWLLEELGAVEERLLDAPDVRTTTSPLEAHLAKNPNLPASALRAIARLHFRRAEICATAGDNSAAAAHRTQACHLDPTYRPERSLRARWESIKTAQLWEDISAVCGTFSSDNRSLVLGTPSGELVLMSRVEGCWQKLLGPIDCVQGRYATRRYIVSEVEFADHDRKVRARIQASDTVPYRPGLRQLTWSDMPKSTSATDAFIDVRTGITLGVREAPAANCPWKMLLARQVRSASVIVRSNGTHVTVYNESNADLVHIPIRDAFLAISPNEMLLIAMTDRAGVTLLSVEDV
jgi:hypothetical protein